MKEKKHNLFRRILVMVFILITVLSVSFILITYQSAIKFYQVSTQLLNKDVAAHIAKFTSPFEYAGLNHDKADSVFYQAMVISPNVEVYFLDTSGRVIYYHGGPDEIKLEQLPMKNISRYISDSGKNYITGPDPRDPSQPKIFSAAAVEGKQGRLGYIYVILGSKVYRNVSHLLYKTYAGQLLLVTFLLILLATITLSFLYINRLRRNFKNMIGVLQRFELGDLKARFVQNKNDDLAPVTGAFNKMAGLLELNIDKLKNTETERRDFTRNISHDLRTPLSIARGYAETLALREDKDQPSSSERTGYARLVIANIQIVENMVEQLLDLSKMESPGMELDLQPFIFSEIVMEFVHSASLAVAEKQIVLEASRCANASWIQADIHMMERVVQNLLFNAIKFTPEYGDISISLENNNDELIFQISNTGEPLPDQLMNWLQDHDGGQEIKRPHSRGLGLVIVNKILQLHGFLMRVQYVEAAGNIISFHMPVYQMSLNREQAHLLNKGRTRKQG